MTTNVTVPGYAISSGGVQHLGVCPRHGRPASGVRKQKFGSKTPLWIIAIAIFTLLIAAIVAEAIRKRVTGPIPTCGQCDTDRKRFHWQVAGLWALDVALLVGGLSGNAFALLGWLALTLIALVYGTQTYRYSVQGTVSDDGMWVELKKVDAAFAEASNRAMAAAQGQVLPPVSYPATMGTTILPQ